MLPIIDTLGPLGRFFVVKAEHVGVGDVSLESVLNASAIELAKKVNKEYVDEQIATIPKVTKTSQLQNDSGFLTEHQSLANYALKSELPTKISQLQNDKGFITSVSKSDVGLSNVDNTSDANKPISSAAAERFASVEERVTELENTPTIIPEASITEEKLTDELRRRILNDFVTPEMYQAVGDGTTDDSQAIQNAINNANGKLIVLNAIYYTGEDAVIKIKDGTHIVLNGTIKAGRKFIFTNTDGNPHPVYSGVGNITFEGSGTIDVSADTTLNANSIFRFSHASNITIKGITIKEFGGFHAIELASVSDVVIDGVQFVGMGNIQESVACAIQIEDADNEEHQSGAIPFDHTPCKNITIQNCYFGDRQLGKYLNGAVQGGASEYVYHDNIKILNNIFENLTHSAITPRSFRNALISGNVAYNIGFSFVESTSSQAIALVDSVISGNVVNKVGYGITVTASARFAICLFFSRNVLISDNIVKDGNIGAVTAQNSENIKITDNQFYCCRWNYEKKVDSYRMLYLAGTEGVEIYSNKFYLSDDDTYTSILCTSYPDKYNASANTINISKNYVREYGNLNIISNIDSGTIEAVTEIFTLTSANSSIKKKGGMCELSIRGYLEAGQYNNTLIATFDDGFKPLTAVYGIPIITWGQQTELIIIVSGREIMVSGTIESGKTIYWTGNYFSYY